MGLVAAKSSTSESCAQVCSIRFPIILSLHAPPETSQASSTGVHRPAQAYVLGHEELLIVCAPPGMHWIALPSFGDSTSADRYCSPGTTLKQMVF
jgi:hypothetical protein